MTIDNIDIEATLQKVEKLLSEERGLSPAMRSMAELLVLPITPLVGRLKRNSRNSSKPPSSDSNRRRESKARGERKAGGQKGREGMTLERVENPDKVEVIRVDRRKLPCGKYKAVGYEARQAFDINYKRIQEYFEEQMGIVVSEGFLYNFNMEPKSCNKAKPCLQDQARNGRISKDFKVF